MTTNENKQVLVSVCCVVYNHEKSLRKCLDGFVSQKTNFLFEVLVHDDLSTDDSAVIIREYQNKYPHIIKTIFEVENQYSKQVDILNDIMFPKCSGKYIALCEGDDFWVDDEKLQKQVDIMEANSSASLCITAYIEHKRDGEVIDKRAYDDKVVVVPKKDVIEKNGCLFATSTMFFLKDKAKKAEWNQNLPIGDIPLLLTLSYRGEVLYLNDITSCYRSYTEGSWSDRMEKSFPMRIDFHKMMIKMWKGYDNWTKKSYHSLISLLICYNIKQKYLLSIKYFLFRYCPFLFGLLKSVKNIFSNN